MALTPHQRATGRRNGGLQTVALRRASKADTAPVAFHVKEDEARYNETVAPDGLVTHELTFYLERMDASSRRAVEQLSQKPLIAHLTTNNGHTLIVGQSTRFGLKYPLRLVAAKGDTGATLADSNGESIVLRSVDTQKSDYYG